MPKNKKISEKVKAYIRCAFDQYKNLMPNLKQTAIHDLLAEVFKVSPSAVKKIVLTHPNSQTSTEVISLQLSNCFYCMIINKNNKQFCVHGEQAEKAPKGPTTKPKTDLPPDVLYAIRKLVYDFHKTNKKVVTLKALAQEILHELNLRISITSLWRVLRSLGFRFIKAKNNRCQLIQRPDIQIKRRAYLNKIREYRQQKKKIVYVDESYLHINYSVAKQWDDGSSEGFKSKIGKGARFAIINAGTDDGFLDNTLLFFQSNAKNDDYHTDMNEGVFAKWCAEKLIPNLSPGSVVVLDNAAYHCVYEETNRPPNSNNRKQDIIDWISARVDVFFLPVFIYPFRLDCR